jgi:hypothetical protein
MKKSRPATATRLYTPRATLAAIRLKIRSLKLLDALAQHVHIRQKTIKHTPIEKLTDAFIAILSGAHGLCEVNTRVRCDAALQRAFGRTACAEQSPGSGDARSLHGRERAADGRGRGGDHSRSLSGISARL